MIYSKYLSKQTSFLINIIRTLYTKYVNEPYIPKGKIKIWIYPKTDNIHRNRNEVQIRYLPNRFVPGNLENYFWEDSDCEIVIIK